MAKTSLHSMKKPLPSTSTGSLCFSLPLVSFLGGQDTLRERGQGFCMGIDRKGFGPLSCALCFLWISLCVPNALFAQNKVTVTGVVMDRSGAVVPGVQVLITKHPNTNGDIP